MRTTLSGSRPRDARGGDVLHAGGAAGRDHAPLGARQLGSRWPTASASSSICTKYLEPASIAARTSAAGPEPR